MEGLWCDAVLLHLILVRILFIEIIVAAVQELGGQTPLNVRIAANRSRTSSRDRRSQRAPQAWPILRKNIRSLSILRPLARRVSRGWQETIKRRVWQCNRHSSDMPNQSQE